MTDSPVRVLVVDDNPGDARLVDWALAHEPESRYEFARAARVSEAVAALARGPVDAVLLDLGLPDSSGSDGLRRLRAESPDVAVVVLTGSDDPLRIRDAIAAGAQDFQVKGVFPKGHLTRVLRTAIRRQGIENEVRRGEPPRAESLAAASDEGDALVLLADGSEPVVNDAWVDLTGISRERLRPIPSWLSRLVAGSPVGDIVLDRPGGGSVAVEYVVRRFGDGPGARQLVRLRNRFPAAGPGASPDVARPAPTSAPSEEEVDAAAWEQLRELAGDDPTFLVSLVGTFVQEGRAQLARLEAAAAAGDRGAVERIAHNLKSGCAQVGALGLSRKAGELERTARGEDPERTREGVARVAAGFPGVVVALERRRAELTSSSVGRNAPT